MSLRKIIWTKRALAQLKAAIEYIENDSPYNAARVQKAILEKIEHLTGNTAGTVKILLRTITMVISCIFKC